VTATILSCGNGDESSSVPVEPNIARFAGGVRKAFTSIPSGRADRHHGQHDRRRLVIADERPGCLPEDVFHHVCRDRQPPVRDHFPRRDVPFQGERDVREQPGQPGQRLAVRPAQG